MGHWKYRILVFTLQHMGIIKSYIAIIIQQLNYIAISNS